MSHDEAHHRWSSPGAARVTIEAVLSRTAVVLVSTAVAAIRVPVLGVRGARSSHVLLPCIGGVPLAESRVAVAAVEARSITIRATTGGRITPNLPLRLRLG